MQHERPRSVAGGRPRSALWGRGPAVTASCERRIVASFSLDQGIAV